MRKKLLLGSTVFAVVLLAGFLMRSVLATSSAVLTPTAEGNYLQWTPSTGSTHYTLVDETPCNGTTDYNFTTTVGNRDAYGVSLSSIGDGAVISQVAIAPCASRNNSGGGSATMNVFYRYNAVNSADAGAYALSGTTPTQLATTTFASLNLFKTSTSTLEIGAILSAGTKGARLSRIATVLTYTLTTPTSASSFAATNSSSTTNALSWTDNSTNELGFKVYRALNGGSFSQTATTTLNAVSYNDTGLTADQTYAYYVTAYNSNGGNPSNTATTITYYTIPAVPSGLTAAKSGSDTILTWTDNSTNEDGFKIERSSDGVGFSQIATTTLHMGSGATYTDTGAAGTYYYRIRAYNPLGNSAYTDVASNILVITVSGTISSATTWQTNVYVLSGTVTVAFDVRLTIKNSAILKFNGSAAKLVIDGGGILDAQGSSTSSLYFTSYHDDSVGGNTDATSITPLAGDWDMLKLNTSASATIAHSVLRYAGNTGFGSVYNSVGSLTLQNSEVSQNAAYGVYHHAGTSVVKNSNIHDHSNYGVYTGTGGGTLTLTNNAFSNNSSGAAYVNLINGRVFAGSGNTASGSGVQGFIMTGSLDADQTWSQNSLAYVLSAVTVSFGNTLTLGAGAVFKGNGADGKLTVSGNLHAQGTSASSVYFTSYHDDSVGGDTDATSITPLTADWDMIRLNSGASATLTHAVVRYGGYATLGAIRNTGGTLIIQDSEIGPNYYYGIRQDSGTSRITSAHVHDHTYGIYALAGYLTIAHNTYANNSTANEYIAAGVTGGFLEDGTLTENTTWTSTSGLPYIISSSGLTVTSGVTLTINPGTIVKFNGSSAKLNINGTLRAYGTSGSKIYFTSYKDDSVGGDSNGDSSGSSPAAGDWGNIEFGTEVSSTISYAIVRYGGNDGAIYNNGGFPVIENTEVATSSNAGIYQAAGTTAVLGSYIHHNTYGIWVNGGFVNIQGNAILENSIYGLFNGTASILTAQNNWWRTWQQPSWCDGSICSDTASGSTAVVDYLPWHHNNYWWSVRNGGLKWKNSNSQYVNDLDAATFNWNSATAGMGIIEVSPESVTANANIVIYDTTTATLGLLGLTNAYTAAAGQQDTIRFFTNNIEDEVDRHAPDGWKWRRWTILHEMGHALGLGHSDPTGPTDDIMYSEDNGVIDFGNEDKSDYNFLWGTMAWVNHNLWWP